MSNWQPCGIITITTDFGHKGPFTAVMKGVILKHFADASIIDLTHDIPAHWPPEAGFWIDRSYQYFPKGSIHVAIVDPGVGTQREIIIAEYDGHVFMAPDNGLLAPILDKSDIVYHLAYKNLQTLGLPAPSATFHGRDIFAPVSAHLAQGAAISDLGPRLEKIEQLILPRADYQKREAKGEILFIDHFGNAITNIMQMKLEPNFQSDKIMLTVGNYIIPLVTTFGDVAVGESLAYYGSGGFVEIALNGGSAAEEFNLQIEQKVEITLK